MGDDEILTTTRFYIQRILTPIVVVIGIAGNLLTVVVLTRKRMRSSTNVYLTALAIADIICLLFSFLLTIQHYPNVHQAKYVAYWSFFGIIVWFRDAASYVSIYLIVCFTIERYISVCHPLRGQVLCTESRAKKVIAAVYILCFMFTITTPFEYQFKHQAQLVHSDTTELCIKSRSESENYGAYARDHKLLPSWGDTPNLEFNDPSSLNVSNSNQTSSLSKSKEESENEFDSRIVNHTIAGRIHELLHINGCVWIDYAEATYTDFGENTTYRIIFHYLTIFITSLLPLVLITVFNCCLVAAVHRSHKLRRRMTSARQDDQTVSQENKVTITLIAVVILFMVSQVPLTIYTHLLIPDVHPSPIQTAINNILNFLVDVTAASNFILYCALSDKYRKTVRHLICGRKITRKSTLTSSRFQTSRTGTSFYSRTNNSNGSFFHPTRRFTPKNLTIVEPKRFSISKEEYENLQVEAGKQKLPRLSVSSHKSAHESRNNSIVEDIPMKPIKKSLSPFRNIRFSISSVGSHKDAGIQKDDPHSEAEEPLTETNSLEQEKESDSSAKRDSLTSQTSNKSQSRANRCFLRPSPSETSFTRTRSLELPPKVKHSPDCRDNPVKL